MSYARFLEGDVYVYSDIRGGMTCCGCGLLGGPTFSFRCRTREQMVTHLRKHQAAGHVVPKRALDRLRSEIKARKKARAAAKRRGK